MKRSDTLKKNAVVLFYPTGIVHMRNLEVMRKHLPDFRFRVIVEPWMIEKAPEVLEKIEKRDLVIKENKGLPQRVWETTVNILFLSMAYPNPFRLHLVDEAAQRDIPVMAIEEVNQLALNDGIINHYFLPIDYFGVPSVVEKGKFMELGVPGKAIEVTGWPFFDEEAAAKKRYDIDIKEQYAIPRDKKCCLLVLGSLKEYDMVSLETRGVRFEILDVVSKGLPGDYQLLIKPHPIETKTALEEIKNQVPNAILLNPKHPIEPILAQSEVVVNRGNSQVTLLAMKQNKPLIVVPVGLRTIFHNSMNPVIANSSRQFKRILQHYSSGQTEDYQKILRTHFPLTQEQALVKVKELFRAALEKGVFDSSGKKIYISILYAFLEDTARAKEIADAVPENGIVSLLKKLYDRIILPGEFKTLLNHFPGKITRWHLQALFVRVLLKSMKKNFLSQGVGLLEGFGGEVNPHYFIDEIIGRIELEYQRGDKAAAQQFFEKYCEDYSVFHYYKQAFDMLHYVYQRHPKHPKLFKTLWLLKNWNKNYTRKFIKGRVT